MTDSGTGRAATRCATHGLAFDSSKHTGCVVCRRERGEPVGASPAVESSTTSAADPRDRRRTQRWIVLGVFGVLALGCWGGLVIARRKALGAIEGERAAQAITREALLGTWDEVGKPGDFMVFRADGRAEIVESRTGTLYFTFTLDAAQTPAHLDLTQRSTPGHEIPNPETLLLIVERLDESQIRIAAKRGTRPVDMTDGKVATLVRRSGASP